MLPSNTRHNLREYCRLWRFAWPGAFSGALVYVGLFAACIWLYGSFSIQGVQMKSVEETLHDEFLWDTVFINLRVLLFAALLGAGLGLVSSLYGRLVFGRERWEKLPYVLALLLVVGGVAYATLAQGLHSLLHYPQLYVSPLYNAGGFRRELQLLLTENLAPEPFLFFALALPVALYVLAGRQEERRRRAVAASLAFGVLVLVTYLWHVEPAPEFKFEPPAEAGEGPLNVLILGGDSLRPDRFSGLGYRRDTTPAMDQLIKNGSSFPRTYVPAPRTFPSLVTLNTGLYPFQHGIRNMFPAYDVHMQPFPALPRILRERGYETIAVSDYAGEILSRVDLGFSATAAPYWTFYTMIEQRSLEIQYALLPWLETSLGHRLFPELELMPQCSDPFRLAHKILGQIDARPAGRPFYLFSFFSTAHFPYGAPYPYYRWFTDPDYRGPYKYLKENRIDIQEEVTAGDVAHVNGLFDGALRAIDAAAAIILDGLRRRGLLRNTIVVVLADHGETLYEAGRPLGHGDNLLGDESLTIPFIIYHPSAAYLRGQVLRGAVRSVDVVPTLAEMLGVPVPEGARGVSLAPAMRGAPLPPLDVYAETGLWFIDRNDEWLQQNRIMYPPVVATATYDRRHDNDVVLRDEFAGLAIAAKHRMFIRGGWKYLYLPLRGGVRQMLFDLNADPECLHDLAQEMPGTVTALSQALREFVGDRDQDWWYGGYILPKPRRTPPANSPGGSP